MDRAACAWLVRRYVDPDAEFVFVDDPADVPADATAFDMRGAELSHHEGDCTFETILRRYGLDVTCRGLSMVAADADIVAVTGPLFDGLYEYRRRASLLGREPG